MERMYIAVASLPNDRRIQLPMSEPKRITLYAAVVRCTLFSLLSVH